ncbi:hypothetical protein PF005_g21798 [Phytophthora fragariae]|uniref:Secreted protein n=1 Tax=Phytophthora fragariae TaxID=53985 RepID=A0A6A4CC00_9STRA|nr:hypothetical protein PF003_g9055 [Phytophthora fragariae]KAE8927119.1 hypothetical protein PF009_g22708 [Phytophthora fragariae]KAE8985195.1 hypothetical protein PF011_g20485 [Phytophthora fragariae]KAE9083628.1 hypothetical protein PF007_g21827 [Phytophthora fragariae]KAE9083684.1 hypothetical protein PF010_g21121 [Phytophthora fragariae]
MSSVGGASGSTLELCSLALAALGPVLGSGTLGVDLVGPGVPATSATSLVGTLATLRPRRSDVSLISTLVLETSASAVVDIVD